MSNKLGRFELLSEIHHSEIGVVYKASDPESSQTVALKTIRLELFGEQAGILEFPSADVHGQEHFGVLGEQR